MAFISVFDVLGPNMIGPSSSHTAGAEIIAFLAQKMIAPPLRRVDFTLYGSFAKTYHGHGTDRALLGGIMGFSADDTRIRDSFAIATERGLAYSFTPNEAETDIYPNTVDIRMENAAGRVMTVRGESLGGGKVRIVRINGVEVDFTGEYNALIVVQQDKPGGWLFWRALWILPTWGPSSAVQRPSTWMPSSSTPPAVTRSAAGRCG